MPNQSLTAFTRIVRRLLAVFGVAWALCGATAFASAQIDTPVTVSAHANAATASPGSHFVIAVVMEHEPEWHSHTNNPVIPRSWGDFPAIPTVVAVTKADHAKVGPVQWPEPHTVFIDLAGTGRPDKYGVFDGHTVIFVPVIVDADAQGSVGVDIAVTYQACNDTICLRTKTERVHVEVPLGSEATPAPASPDFKDVDESVFANSAAFQAITVVAAQAQPPAPVPGAPVAAVGGSFFGIPLPQGGGIAAMALLFVFAALGGLILNLTPCVLPVIPLKIMALTQHAKSPGQTFYLGAWMAAGVVAFWVGIGVPAMLLTSWSDPSQIFARWWVTFGMGVVIAVMAVGMMGLFQFTLPQSVHMINPKADSPGGSFVFGVMTAVLGLPCFGFIAGALLAATATLPKLATLTVYAGIGVGMATYRKMNARYLHIDAGTCSYFPVFRDIPKI